MNKKLIVHSLILAFILSLLLVIVIIPESKNVLLTSILSPSGINIQFGLLLKIVLILVGQTSILGTIFYSITKKIFN